MRLTTWGRSPLVRLYRRRFHPTDISSPIEVDALREYMAKNPKRYRGVLAKHGMTRDECTATIKQWAESKRGKQQ